MGERVTSCAWMGSLHAVTTANHGSAQRAGKKWWDQRQTIAKQTTSMTSADQLIASSIDSTYAHRCAPDQLHWQSAPHEIKAGLHQSSAIGSSPSAGAAPRCTRIVLGAVDLETVNASVCYEGSMHGRDAISCLGEV